MSELPYEVAERELSGTGGFNLFDEVYNTDSSADSSAVSIGEEADSDSEDDSDSDADPVLVVEHAFGDLDFWNPLQFRCEVCQRNNPEYIDNTGYSEAHPEWEYWRSVGNREWNSWDWHNNRFPGSQRGSTSWTCKECTAQIVHDDLNWQDMWKHCRNKSFTPYPSSELP